MQNELMPNNPSALSVVPNSAVQAVQQTGEKNVYANHIDQLNLTVQNINTVPPLIAQVQNRPIAFPNCDYYSLIVSNDLDIPNLQPFTMETDRSLTEYMDDEVKAVFSTLSEEVQKRILTFPSIFANENTAYGHTDESQILGLGYIRQIKVRRDAIKIYPQVLLTLSQQRLNEALFDLDIHGTISFNEFNRTHWCIKKVDLIAELRELGFQL